MQSLKNWLASLSMNLYSLRVLRIVVEHVTYSQIIISCVHWVDVCRTHQLLKAILVGVLSSGHISAGLSYRLYWRLPACAGALNDSEFCQRGPDMSSTPQGAWSFLELSSAYRAWFSHVSMDTETLSHPSILRRTQHCSTRS
jgi:hypothetical protein